MSSDKTVKTVVATHISSFARFNGSANLFHIFFYGFKGQLATAASVLSIVSTKMELIKKKWKHFPWKWICWISELESYQSRCFARY